MVTGVVPAEVEQARSSNDPALIDALFRRVLAALVPAGTVQPRWIAGRELTGVFEGFGAVRDFADWCEATGADPGFEFGPVPEVVLYCRHRVGTWAFTVSCTADETDARAHFRLNAGWGTD